MTIAGLTIAAPDRAFVWADVEIFGHDDTIRRGDKIAVSYCAKMAAVGVGWRSVSLAAFDAFRRADHIDDAVRALPVVMRHAAARVADRQADRAGFLTCALGLVGWSPSARRVCAWRLDADQMFAPEPAGDALWTAADLMPELLSLHPADPADLLGLVSGQLAALQRHSPNIAGDAVHVATVTADGVALRAFRLPPLGQMQPTATQATSGALFCITDSCPAAQPSPVAAIV